MRRWRSKVIINKPKKTRQQINHDAYHKKKQLISNADEMKQQMTKSIKEAKSEMKAAEASNQDLQKQNQTLLNAIDYLSYFIRNGDPSQASNQYAWLEKKQLELNVKELEDVLKQENQKPTAQRLRTAQFQIMDLHKQLKQGEEREHQLRMENQDLMKKNGEIHELKKALLQQQKINKELFQQNQGLVNKLWNKEKVGTQQNSKSKI